jgi:hypothetical protein
LPEWQTSNQVEGLPFQLQVQAAFLALDALAGALASAGT